MNRKKTDQSYILYFQGLVDFVSVNVSPGDIGETEQALQMAMGLCENGLLKHSFVSNEIVYLVFQMNRKKLWNRICIQFDLEIGSDFAFVIQKVGEQ